MPRSQSISHAQYQHGLPVIVAPILAYLLGLHFTIFILGRRLVYRLYHFRVPPGLTNNRYYRTTAHSSLPFSKCYPAVGSFTIFAILAPLLAYHFRLLAGLPFLNCFRMLDFPLGACAVVSCAQFVYPPLVMVVFLFVSRLRWSFCVCGGCVSFAPWFGAPCW